MRTRIGLVALTAAAVLAMSSGAFATMPIQKKAKDAGYPAATCQYCHVDKLPKKDAPNLNERGKFLQAEKQKRKAAEVDVAWLKGYVEKPAK